MPRSPLKLDPRIERIRAALRDYVLAVRGRQMSIEKATGVKQYTISRFISGRRRKLSPAIEAVCKYAEIETDSGIGKDGDNARLKAALSKVWDGRPETAELIAVLIESLGPILLALRRQSTKRNSGERP
jgi:hypothetical protein